MTPEERRDAVRYLRTASEMFASALKIDGPAAHAVLDGAWLAAFRVSKAALAARVVASAVVDQYREQRPAAFVLTALEQERAACERAIAELEAGADPLSDDSLHNEREADRRAEERRLERLMAKIAKHPRGCAPETGRDPGEPALLSDHERVCEQCRVACSGMRPPEPGALCLEGVRILLHWSTWGAPAWRAGLAERDAQRAAA